MTLLDADDRWAIASILSLTGHIFDTGQLDRLEDVFSPGVVYDLTDPGLGSFEGIEVLRKAALQLGERSPIAHHVTNIVITDEAGDTVTVISKGLVIGSDGKIGSVNHRDTVIRHDGQWRISRRVITAQRGPFNAACLANADDR